MNKCRSLSRAGAFRDNSYDTSQRKHNFKREAGTACLLPLTSILTQWLAEVRKPAIMRYGVNVLN
jgi:hypothetical protein